MEGADAGKIRPVQIGSPIPNAALRWNGATVKSPKDRRGRSQVSLLVHEIGNLLCSVRLHADSLSSGPQTREAVAAIVTASSRIEAQVARLASLAKKTSHA